MKKKLKVICNPPITFVTNSKTHYGHLFYHTIFDVSLRFRRKFLKENAYFPSRVYNLYGKPSEKFMDKNRLTLFQFRRYFRELLAQDWKVRDINLSNKDIVVDQNRIVENKMKQLLKILWNKGKIIKKKDQLYLNLDSIKYTDFKNKIEQINIFPECYRKIILNQLKIKKNILRITRNRDYAPSTGLFSKPTAPFFVVSNFWDAYFPKSKFILVCTPNLVIKVALFRMQVHYLAYGKLGLEEIIVFPKLIHYSLDDNLIERLSESQICKDILRLSFSNNFSLKKSKTRSVDETCKFGLAFVNKLFSIMGRVNWLEKESNKLKLTGYINLMKKYKYKQVLNVLMNKMNLILDSKKEITKKTFLEILECSSPFVPHIYEKIKKSKDKVSSSKILMEELKVLEVNILKNDKKHNFRRFF
tara:strand:- start:290 stop:1537 length:1248 start_codon:yes stop_codon:yes gene_type:complete